ncbi:methyl-accepting chemotaxis protein [Cuneatibacter sp. NSJ-177]|uniref:methyl-accepting chemotaxis protein n=1 Tax=Cuneatibacter sp. NSJ-177 TaxID=2931401 RepID=UPI001FD10424|nr:HAMP domain-containing methyl-accepting chemotaxis protein [Cuneatibacter sp. NSJ-177]MCJ7835927.1 methyl-accepting chemotaxis protein [Cuneatibacter sp. NSJ-177]
MKKSRIKDYKVGKKLFVSYAAIIVLYVITVAAALIGIISVSNTIRSFHQDAFEVVYTSMDMRFAIQGIGRDILDLGSAMDSIDEDQKLEEVKNYVQILDQGIETLKVKMPENEKVRALAGYLADVAPSRDEAIRILESGSMEGVLTIYNEEYEPNAILARNTLREISDLSVETAEAYLGDTQTVKNQMILTMVLLAALIILVSIMLWSRITKSITEPMKEIQEAARQLCGGNLSVALNYQAKDELGDLADSMRETTTALSQYVSELDQGLHAIGDGKLNYHSEVKFRGDFLAVSNAMERITTLLNHAILQISNTADQIAGGAEQVANGAQMLSQGAVEQAGSMQELAANINEISDGVRNNADDSVNASRKINQVNGLLTDSSGAMGELIKEIRNINENSMTIGKIVKEVEDIAFQTNILALNASVEAARAGDAGRGFSVVANEVRHLAAKTTEASKMMAGLAQQTLAQVESGTRAADRATTSMDHVVDGTQEIIEMVDRISDASVRQADSIVQIRQSIEMVSEIVQGNSAMAEESAAASEELSAQAQVLKKLVEEFEL